MEPRTPAEWKTLFESEAFARICAADEVLRELDFITALPAAEVLADGFDTHPAEDGSWTLPGVVSRKKQFIPALMTAYQEL